MAAVLCKGIGNLCSGVCKGCTKICTVPCRIGCDGLAALCTNPFCLYVTATIGLNIPPISIGLTAASDALNGCKGSLWLLVDVIICAINICASLYIAAKFRNGEEYAGTNSFNRALSILLYDPIVAVYIVVLLGFFGWLCVGVSWRISGNLNGDGVCRMENVESLVGSALIFGWAFLVVGFFALCLSLCCSCCDMGTRRDSNVYSVPNTRNQSQNHTAQSPTHETYSSPNNTYQGKTQDDIESKIPQATPVQTTPITATVVEPSAPPADQAGKAAASGSAFGAKLGKMFNANDKTKANLQNAGAKASVATSKGFNAIKQMAGMSK